MNDDVREEKVIGPALQATPVPGYLIEPVVNGPSSWWEGHHASNPCAVRLSCDPRVFLGYRAGGAGDYFRIKGHDVWRSHLGMTVLNVKAPVDVDCVPVVIAEKLGRE